MSREVRLSAGLVAMSFAMTWGGDAMAPVDAVPFFQTKLLEDLGAVASGGSLYLVTVEHTYEMVDGAAEPTEKAEWRVWASAPDGDRFREASNGTAAFPVATSVVMTERGGALTALALTNRSSPAALFRAEGKLPRIGAFGDAIPLRLEPGDAARIQLKPPERWNTRDLPPDAWLFHPSLIAGANGAAVAMNTADGHAVALIVAESEVRRVAFVAGALNPVLLNLPGGNHLLYRKMPPEWPMYYHDTRYSGKYGPVALPLMMAALDANGSAEPVDAAGLVFDFAAASPDGKRIALALIAGSRAAPELRIFERRDLKSAFVPRRTVPIRSIPYRLAIAATNANILIGLAFKNNAGFDLQGLTATLE
jgi:hypothetical protein